MKDPRYKIITKKSDITTLIKNIKKTGYCCFDFETSSTNYYDEDEYPTILGVSYQIGCCIIIPLGHEDSPFKKSYPKILQRLSKEVFENPNIVKIAQNISFEYKWLLRYNCNLKGKLFDTMLAKYLLDEERPNDLKSLVARFYPEYAYYDDEISTLSGKYGWGKIPLEPLSKYCAYDCIMEFRLMVHFERLLIDKGFYNLFRNFLMPLVFPLSEAEYRGMKIDKPYLDKITEDYRVKLESFKKELSNHKIVKRYEKYRVKQRIKDLIEETREEIEELREEDLEGNATKINNREEKISRYIAGELVSKKELKLVEPVNFNSPKQLIELLFTSKKGFKFPIIKYTINKDTKQETDTPSTDEEVLLELQGEDKTGFIDTVLKIREYGKLYSTYMVGIQERVDKNNILHTSYKIHGTTTGRLSSVKPNLQNIPRSTTSSLIKRMFISPPGYIMLELDYSQAELRVVAELAGEKDMLRWFNENRNIHVAVACKANNKEDEYDKIYPITKDEDHPDHEFWKKQKKRAKTISFGILYGQSDKKLAETLNCSVDKATRFKKEWFSLFPRIEKWVRGQHTFVQRHGYVKNLFGRKRRLPNALNKDNFGLYAESLRQSINAPIQATASDFTLFSGIMIRELILENKLPSDIRLIYTVHDSLGFWIQPKDVHKFVKITQGVCENPDTKKWFGFEMKKVKMKVSYELGNNWGDYHDYDPDYNYNQLIK